MASSSDVTTRSSQKRDPIDNLEAMAIPRKRLCIIPTPCSPNDSGQHDDTLLPDILRLPSEVVDSILIKTGTFAEVGRLRLVCRHFNTTGQRILTKGFNGIQTTVQSRLHIIKSQMPRRESSRRKHPLARECDIMETLHMRLVLLQMTFGKHIEKGHCCFFAGEILDEILHIVRYTRSSAVLGRVYKVTDELFDLSTMAMEYFKERIEPSLPQVSYFSADLPIPPANPLTYTTVLQRPTAGPSRLSGPQNPRASPGDVCKTLPIPLPVPLPKPHKWVSRRVVRVLRRDLRRTHADLTGLKREVRTSKAKVAHQNRLLKEYAARLEQHENRFDGQTKKIEALTKDLGQFRAQMGRATN